MMKQASVVLCLWLFIAQTHVAAGDPAWPGKHPLTTTQAGEVLISELRCAACHGGRSQTTFPEKTAPDLANVGSRVAPSFLRQFLASPSTAHPGTSMPDVLPSKSEAEKQTIAEALTHFLVAQSTTVFSPESPKPSETLDGRSLYHSVGCVACHGPRNASARRSNSNAFDASFEDDDADVVSESVKPIAHQLGHVASKYGVASLSEFLFQPLHVRSSGRMPDMKLTPSESLAIASYLVGQSPQAQSPLVPDNALAAKGKTYFQELNCAACHAMPSFTPAPLVGSLQNADLGRGCLSKSSGKSPRFVLDESQVNAIQSAIKQGPTVDSDQVTIAKTLTAFNCIACHVRDDFGGVHEAYDQYFASSDEKLGDDGRIPPPLTLVGAKLRPAWMKKVLFDGESVRHYMKTRMPQYGDANLQHLPALFTALDVLESVAMSIPSPESRDESQREREKVLRAAGRELLGDKGVNCIACHQFNGKAAVANQGMDLMTSYERLQPGWFNRYLRNPNAFRPRTVMPSAWPDGVAAFKTILDGDTDKQIEAIWYYMSLGTSAADPSGIRAISTKIPVNGQTVTYRGRSRVAGFRGIAVGLPERLSYAFNAETGTIAAIWQGDFIGVNWSGQGSGDFNPASEPLTLAQDVSFAQLASENEPWPLMPVMTKEARTNLDPLYPKNVGYQFLGYDLDAANVPTLQYRFGMIEIADRSIAVGTEEHRQLNRVLELDSPVPQTVWFRALTGNITSESDRVFRRDRLRLIIPDTETQLRPLASDPTQSELLLRIDLPQGKSTLEFIYEPLNK